MIAFSPQVLRTWRLESERRPEQVCAEAGISVSYLNALMYGGRANPSATVLARIAAAYGRPVGDLFTDDAVTAGAR